MNYDVKIKKLPNSEVELECVLPAEELDKMKPKAIKKFSETIQIDGFRKGNVPEKLILEKIGERAILDEAAELTLSEHYGNILIEAKIDAIGRPTVSITKMAFGNPLEFKVKTAVMPVFELPDYKKIAKNVIEKEKNKEEKLEATDKELNDVLLQIRKNKAHIDWHQAHKDEQGHNHPDLEKSAQGGSAPGGNLPALDDELAKSAGNFKNVDELKEKIKENIIEEKKLRNIDKRRAIIMDELLKNTKIEIPNILIGSEVEKSIGQMKDDVTRMGANQPGAPSWEDYLKHIKKNEEDLRKELREPSEKRAKLQLVFNKIAVAEKIEPNKEVLENEVKQIMEHYKDASEQNARIYVATMLLNQEVLKLLENS